MDLQRNILIVALLAVSYLLFVTWQNDYNGIPAEQTAAPASTTSTNTDANSAAIAPMPAAPASNSNSDLAGLAPAGSATPASVPETPSTVTSRRISVRTDVFDLQIDLAGGDITDLSLPLYPMSQQTPDKPVRLMSTENITYIAQSGLASEQGPDVPNTSVRPVYTTSASQFELAADAKTLEVVLSLPPLDGVTVEKVFRFTRGDYLINISYRVRNEGTTPWSGFLFGQIKRDASGDPAHPGGGGFFSATPTYLGAAYTTADKPYKKADFEDVVEAPLKNDMTGGWIAFLQHYFVSAWVPQQDSTNHFFTRRGGDGNYLYGFTSSPLSVAPGAIGETATGFYAGPKQQDRLREISPNLDLTIDFGILSFIAELLLWLMIHIEMIFGNWGVAIILLTVFVKALFLYPSHISYRSMAHMRRVTPELTRIREAYKDDRQKQSQEMLALYRKEKINPLGGCLPILIQMPVFIALYWVLLESVELRQAPFMLWITDLSAKDPYFVLPILMGISMWFQTKLNPAPPDPMQAKMMQWLPWVFTVFFLFFASGLVLYWLVNNVLSIAQQWYITKKIEKEHAKT